MRDSTRGGGEGGTGGRGGRGGGRGHPRPISISADECALSLSLSRVVAAEDDVQVAQVLS